MKGLLRNVMSAGTGLVGSSVVGLVVSVIIARRLGVEGYGVYGFAVAYVSLWSVVMDGGSAMVATRAVARRQDPGILRALFTMKPVLIVIAYAGLFLGSWTAGFPPPVRDVVLLVGLGAAASACLTLGLAIFRGREEFGTEGLHLLSQRVLFGVLAVAALAVRGGVAEVALASAASWILLAIPAFWLLRRRHAITWSVNIADLGRHGASLLRSAGPLLLSDVLTQLHARNGPIILQLVRGATEVGLYVAGRRLIEGLHLLPSAFGIAFFPRFVSAWGQGQLEGAVRLTASLRFMATVALAVLLAGLLWAGEVVGFLFGSAYAPAVGLLRIMLGALVFMSLNSVLSLALIARGGETGYAVTLGAAAATNLAFNVALVPTLGASAPAWASLVSEAVLFVGCLVMLHRSVRGFLPLAHWGGLLGGAAAALMGLIALKQASPAFAFLLTVAVVVVGFEVMSPIGMRDVVRQLAAQPEFRPSRDL